jgi:hypothetical protein
MSFLIAARARFARNGDDFVQDAHDVERLELAQEPLRLLPTSILWLRISLDE